MTAPVIIAEGVWTAFDGVVVHKDLHLEVRRGEALAIIGSSGSGKTTLLKEMLGPVPARIPLRRSSWAALPDTGERFLTTFTGTLGRVNSVLTPDNSQHLSRLLTQLNVAAEGVTAIAHDLQPAVRRVGTVVADADDTLRSAHKTLVDLDTLLADARAHIGALDAVGEGAHETGLAARGMEQALVLDTLPKLNQLLSGLSQNADTLQEFLEQLKEQPQSVLFGAQPRPPGPGERGFSPPRTSQ